MAKKGGLIGALRVTLGLDGAAFETGVKKAKGGAAGFAKSFKVAAAAAAAAFVAMGAAVGAAIKGMVDKADEMTKLSQSIGVPVEELTALAHAADLSGVGIEGLSKGLKKLSQNMFDAVAGLVTPKESFDALGISVTDADGKLKTATQVMVEVAGKFAKMEDGAGKTALAMRLFGKAGADMIPMLNAGEAGLAAMLAEAHELGIVLDKETGQAAERFNDNLTRLGKVKDGITLQLTAAMLPALESFSQTILGAAKNAAGMKAVGAALGGSFKVLISIVLVAIAAFTSLALTVSTVAKAFMAAARGDFAGAWTEIKKGFGDIHDAAQATMGQIPALWRDAGSETAAQAPAVSDQLAAPMVQAAGKTGAAAKEIEAHVREAEAVIAGLASKGEQVSASYTERMAILRREFEAGRQSAEAYGDAVTRLNLEMEAKGGGFDPIDVNVNPPLIPDDGLEQTKANIAAAAEEARTAFGQAFADAALALKEGRLTDLLAWWVHDWARRGLEDAGAALYDILQSMGGWQGVGDAIKGAFGFGSTPIPLPGAANGADFMVNGRAGIDRNIVAFRASRNERVRVETPEQQRAADARPRRGGGETNVTVNNYGPPADVDVRDDGDGGLRIDMRPVGQQAVRSAFADGTAGRAARFSPRPTLRP